MPLRLLVLRLALSCQQKRACCRPAVKGTLMAEAEAACAVLSVSLPASGAESESATSGSAPTMMLASVRVARHSGVGTARR